MLSLFVSCNPKELLHMVFDYRSTGVQLQSVTMPVVLLNFNILIRDSVHQLMVSQLLSVLGAEKKKETTVCLGYR